MNKQHEALKERVTQLEVADAALRVKEEELEKAEKETETARAVVSNAEQQLAHTIWNKCAGKQMIFKGSIYKATRIGDSSGVVMNLVVDDFEGEVL